MPWYQFLHGISLAFCLWRGRHAWKTAPCFMAFIAASAAVTPFYSPWLTDLTKHSWWAFPLLALAGLRVLIAVEAYAKLTLGERVWTPGSMLLIASWCGAAAVILALRATSPATALDFHAILLVRRFLMIWNGLWVLIALLFLSLWGRASQWRHASVVIGLTWIAAAGALAKLSGAAEGPAFWKWEMWSNPLSASLLCWWAIWAAPDTNPRDRRV